MDKTNDILLTYEGILSALGTAYFDAGLTWDEFRDAVAEVILDLSGSLEGVDVDAIANHIWQGYL